MKDKLNDQTQIITHIYAKREKKRQKGHTLEI